MPDYTVSTAAEKNTARFGTWVKTTDATVTTVSTISTTSNKVYLIKAFVVACTEPTVTTNQAAYGIAGLFKNVDGTLTKVGSTGGIFVAIETDAAWDCAFDVTGTSIIVKVTGASATTIVWHAQVDVMVVQNYAEAFGPY